jgi:hypothetical protein
MKYESQFTGGAVPKSAVKIAACLVFAGIAGRTKPANSLNPSLQKIVESVSEQRIRSILAKLESFGAPCCRETRTRKSRSW